MGGVLVGAALLGVLLSAEVCRSSIASARNDWREFCEVWDALAEQARRASR